MIHGLGFAWRFRTDKRLICLRVPKFFSALAISCSYTQSCLYPWNIANYKKIALQIQSIIGSKKWCMPTEITETTLLLRVLFQQLYYFLNIRKQLVCRPDLAAGRLQCRDHQVWLVVNQPELFKLMSGLIETNHCFLSSSFCPPLTLLGPLFIGVCFNPVCLRLVQISWAAGSQAGSHRQGVKNSSAIVPLLEINYSDTKE